MVALTKINYNTIALLIIIFITIFRTVKYNQLSYHPHLRQYFGINIQQTMILAMITAVSIGAAIKNLFAMELHMITHLMLYLAPFSMR